MKLDNVFKKTRIAVGRKNYITFTRRPEVPEGLLRKCNKCGGAIIAEDVKKDHYICPKCGGYFRMHARRRIEMITDEGSFEELFADIKPTDPLEFVDTESYKDRLAAAQAKTGLNDAVVAGLAAIQGHKVATAIMDFDFMGGSMGSVVGEKVTRIMEKALELKLPVLVITSSGGARMQESALSLMQMAKTSCACARLDEAGLLYINLITDPTFGGVTASFGTLGDIIVAEQGARVGFAGRRVIEQTIRQKLPADFQTAEYLMKYGQVDVVSSRKDLRDTLANILAMHE